MIETIKVEEFYTSKIDGFQDRYILEYPAKGVTGPLVLYLHTGLADAEQGFCDSYVFCANRLRDEVIRRGGAFVAPDYRGDSWMNGTVEADTAGLIEMLKTRFRTETVVLTGTSMGGTCALIFASHHPGMVDGVAALCPASDMRELYEEFMSRTDPFYKSVADSIVKAYGGTPAQVPQEYSYRSSINYLEELTMPVVICHGDADEILPVSHSRNLVQALRELEHPVRFDEISGGVHMSPAVDTPWEDYLDFALGHAADIHAAQS